VELAPSKPSVSGPIPQSSALSQTLGRGLDVLEQVAAGPVALGVIASRLGLSRSTVHRLATSLLERRYLNLAPRRGYSLGPKLLELGSVARSQIGLVRAARPVMELLAEATGDAVLLAVREGDDAVLADSVAGKRRLAPLLRIGERQSLVHSAAGCALLLDSTDDDLTGLWQRRDAREAADFLSRMALLRQSRIVVDAPEADPEIATMAAAVRGADGMIRGALGIATAASYREAGLSPAARDALSRAAEALSQELGWQITNMHDALPGTSAERELLEPRAGFFAARPAGEHQATGTMGGDGMVLEAVRKPVSGEAGLGEAGLGRAGLGRISSGKPGLGAAGAGTAEDGLLSEDDGMKGRGA
jgi:DNA-binding IclR family transcriptional regulator